MPNLVTVRDTAPWFRRLYLPAYRVSDAARYARTSVTNVAHWHYRESYQGQPALPGKEHGKPLSYLELVEVAVVATFRQFKVPLKVIAEARRYMAQTFSSEYPFAEYRFKTDGFHLLLNLSEVLPELPTKDLIVADRGGQIGWNSMMEDRLLEFDYDLDYELALKWFVAGRHSKVVIDPRVAFGAPTVKGLPTWVLKGRWKAGETVNDMKEDFGLTEEEIYDALQFSGSSALKESLLK